jgi:hypothetical protein
MKTIIIILSVWLPLFSFAQKEICKEIHISHTYEDLFIHYIAPLRCEDIQKNGPIIITDSLIVQKICKLLENSVVDNDEIMPDVRFKIEFYYNNKSQILCFGQSGVGMYYLNKLYKYNPKLCSYIISIIEKSGAKKPQKAMHPSKYPPAKKIKNHD